jgi:putative FmdB family regulatory protein
MPTYEYRCPDGHVFERFQKITEKPRTKCPECGKVATRIISGGAGLVFRGSGFYITDYGKDGKGPRKAESDRPAAEKSEAKGSTGDKAEPKKADAPAKPASGGREGKAKPE